MTEMGQCVYIVIVWAHEYCINELTLSTVINPAQFSLLQGVCPPKLVNAEGQDWHPRYQWLSQFPGPSGFACPECGAEAQHDD